MNNYIELLVTLGFLAALMWGMMKFMLRDIHRDIGAIKDEIHQMHADSQEFKQEMRQELKVVHNRIDNLYQILIDLVKKS